MFKLQKDKNKDFKILNLTDVHTDNMDSEDDRKRSMIFTKTIEELIERVKPDIITISGDHAWGGHVKGYDYLCALIDKYNIPFTLVWGNHDQERGYEVLDTFIAVHGKYKNLLYENGPEELGRGNFIVSICEGDKIVEALFMMDTHNRIKYIGDDGKENWGWGKIYPEQIEWYKENVCKLTDYGCRDSMIISHQPIYAYKDAIKASLKDGIDPKTVSVADALKGKHFKDGYETSFGINYEDVCCFPQDDGFINVISELGLTKNYLCGHDHINFSSIVYKGVRLTYGLKTGMGAYWKPELNGGTVYTVTSDGITDIEHIFVDASEWVKE